MVRLGLVLVLATLLQSGCGGPATAPEAAAPGPTLTDVPTSPAGFSDQRPAGLLLTIVQWGRQFRGNPLPLGVATGTMLLVALGLGVYTLRLVGDDRSARPPGS
jgi:hypothetical protein